VRAKTRLGHALTFLLSTTVIAGGLVLGVAAAPAEALSGSEFNAGNIISDAAFYDANAMSEAQIQSFLAAQVGSCANANCLAVATVNTFNRPADAMCAGAYTGAAGERTATVIYKVQVACSISAKVLLVTLQKEQGLITNRAPSDSKLDRAMGYGCPDNTAIPGWCDPAYGGLYNQIYRAAWQLQRYGNPAGTSNYFTWYPVGGVSNIAYNPNANCGSSPVVVRNKATAALYYYTPYQPNASALANLGGVGDSCGSYGNRNFWVYYNNWFGSPLLPYGTPEGSIVSATGAAGGISLTGWAVDADNQFAAVRTSIWVDGKWNYQWLADQSSTASKLAFPIAGTGHGFAGLVPAAPGSHSVCVYAFNTYNGVDAGFGCKTVTVPANSAPSGYVAPLTVVAGGVVINGWAVDPDAKSQAVVMSAWVDDTKNYQWPADADSSTYPALEAQFAGAGTKHAFSYKLGLTPGSHKICVYAFNRGAGADVGFICTYVAIAGDPSPKGEISTATGVAGGVSLSGWTIDPDALTQPVTVSLWLDGLKNFQWPANGSYPAGEASFPGAGANHGWSGVVPASAGSHSVCVYAVNINSGADVLFGCKTVTVPPSADMSPKGEISTATGVAGGVSLSGWTIDPDALTQPVTVSLWLDGLKNFQWPANGSYPAGEASFPGAGAKHGWSGVVPASAGSHSVCVYAVNINSGADVLFGCKTVTVP
jgi:hypothetical protein